MARLATTADVFNAIAEPRRRQIIDLLHDGRDWAVGDVVRRVGLAQPTVSKHLSVLRTVGVVSVRRCGKSRLYRLNPEQLKPVHDWLKTYERYWTHQIDRIRTRAEEKARRRQADAAEPAALPDAER